MEGGTHAAGDRAPDRAGRPGLLPPQAVRETAPRAVAAWWRNARELNRPEPDLNLLKNQFMCLSPKDQARRARQYGYEAPPGVRQAATQ